MRKVVVLITAGAVALSAAVVVLPLLLLVALMGEAENACTTGQTDAAAAPLTTYDGEGVEGLSPGQTQIAWTIIGQGRQMQISDQGVVVALATASQESSFQVYANDGLGGDLEAEQRGIGRSLNLPHDAVGSDHGSLGPFQQQWPWWGNMQELMDPAASAAAFYQALRAVQGWESMPITEAAQAVQRSKYPDAYADDEPLAEALLEAFDSGAAEVADPLVEQVVDGSGASRYDLGPVEPALQHLVDTLGPMFGIGTVGGWRESATDPNGHPAGLAADFMTSSRQQGDDLAAYAQEHAEELGIDYIIWYQQIWSVARAGEGWRPMEDRGGATENHLDHVHVNVLPDFEVDKLEAIGVDLEGKNPLIDCSEFPVAASTSAAAVYPVPADSGYVDQKNYGRSGDNWDEYHTGTDFSVDCGTPVLAATAGTVIVRTDQSWSGPWLVMIQTREGGLTTWYGHMERLDVEDGDVVQTGQQIGAVGAEGNVAGPTGCHLHFEVHPQGGGYAEDDVDPTKWLAKHTKPGYVPPLTPVGADGSTRTRVASFNVLGHGHTGPGGNKPEWPDSPGRTKKAVDLLLATGVDLIGFQEFEPPQFADFQRLTGGQFGMFPHPRGKGAQANVVAWRTDLWKLLRTRLIKIPYFHGQPYPMPYVLLEHRTTGQRVWVASFHNPASVRGPAQHLRNRAVDLQADLVKTLAAETPVLVTGDMNDRKDYYCRMVRRAPFMRAANGGTYAGGRCRPPAGMGIDWIMGSSQVAFSYYVSDESTKTNRIADHPLVWADASIR